MKTLTPEETKERLSGCAGWSLEDAKWIKAAFRFRSFPEAIAFVNEIASVAEAMNHHPMIAVDFRLVTLRLTSWSAGGLTALDLEAAARYNEAYAAVSVQGSE